MSNPDDTDSTQPQAWPPPPPPPLPPAYPPLPAAAFDAPPAVPARTVARQARQSRRRSLSALAVACFLTMAGVVGYTIGANQGSSSVNASSDGAFPSQRIPQFPSFPDSGNGSSSGGSSSGGSSSGSGRQSSIDVNSIAAKVSPSIVNLTSVVDQGEAAGTGIIVSSSGLVLTNNHVIANSTSLQAEIGGSGDTHPAKVLGYDLADDVALVQIENVSGLTPASLGSSSSVQVGDAIVALGNAGGKGGSPSVVSGTVTGVDQQITAADQDGSNPETLTGLLQIDANIQPGDSGGPLVDADGKVVGMDSAASSGNGGFGFGGQASNEGYAIPIENALAIAKKIQAGNGSDRIHVGGHRALLGVSVRDSSSSGDGGNGANVQGVASGSGAESAGIQQGDVIVGIDNTTVTSAGELTHALVKYSPDNKVRVTWTDSSGQNHTATVQLGSGPPA
jgi:S1-C subfamily serine protease